LIPRVGHSRQAASDAEMSFASFGTSCIRWKQNNVDIFLNVYKEERQRNWHVCCSAIPFGRSINEVSHDFSKNNHDFSINATS
jgi:hypothetical protein